MAFRCCKCGKLEEESPFNIDWVVVEKRGDNPISVPYCRECSEVK